MVILCFRGSLVAPLKPLCRWNTLSLSLVYHSPFLLLRKRHWLSVLAGLFFNITKQMLFTHYPVTCLSTEHPFWQLQNVDAQASRLCVLKFFFGRGLSIQAYAGKRFYLWDRFRNSVSRGAARTSVRKTMMVLSGLGYVLVVCIENKNRHHSKN